MKIKLSIKEIMCDVINVNGRLFITDKDANRVINLSKSMRGRKVTKDKLCNTDVKSHYNGVLCFALDTKYVDGCYGNKKELGVLLPNKK
jgi:hypothetical protein